MRLIRRARPGRPALPGGCVATVGTFDGLHLGHQQILARVLQLARAQGLAATVFSFEPTPAEFFSPAAPPARLTRFREKFALLQSLGLDVFYCPPFDAVMEALSPAEFIHRHLVTTLGVRHLVVGDDFRFARARSGTLADLQQGGQEFGFAVEQTPSIVVDGVRVSSTGVRQALAAGELERARRLLGRYYCMHGRVVRGLSLGKELGFPTANVHLNRRATAIGGIFAVRVHGLGQQPLDGVASLGTRPTVNGGGRSLLEVHIFDFDRQIYGQHIRVDFVARLRDELRFPDLAALTAQMHEDAAQARRILAVER